MGSLGIFFLTGVLILLLICLLQKVFQSLL